MMRIKDGTVDGPKQQTCKVCGRQDKFDYHIPDGMWKRVVPRQYRNKVVCLACFDDFASAKRIDYSDSLDVLYFAGDKAIFTFETRSSESV